MWARGAEEALDGRMMAGDTPLGPKDAIKKWSATRKSDSETLTQETLTQETRTTAKKGR